MKSPLKCGNHDNQSKTFFFCAIIFPARAPANWNKPQTYIENDIYVDIDENKMKISKMTTS